MQGKIYPFGPPCDEYTIFIETLQKYIDSQLATLNYCSKDYVNTVLLNYVKLTDVDAYIDKKIEEATAGIEEKVKEIVDAEVDEKIATASTSLRAYVDTSIKDLSDKIQATYCTNEYVDDLLKGYYTKDEIDSKLKLTFDDIIINN